MAVALTYSRPNAQARFKASFWPYVSAATIFSALVHYLVLSNATITITDGYAVQRRDDLEQVILQEREFEIPPAPERIARPAIPVVSTNLNISDQITIDVVSFADTPINAPPPPPTAVPVDVADQPAFTPFEVRPRLSNVSDLEKALISHYPPLLKRAGVGGVTVLWIFIDETGAVRNTRVVETSGFEELDDAAQLAVRESARFTPALNRDIRVPVWIQMPITFATQS
jgi:TonB family protein